MSLKDLSCSEFKSWYFLHQALEYQTAKKWKSDSSNAGVCTAYLFSKPVVQALELIVFYLSVGLMNLRTILDGGQAQLQETQTKNAFHSYCAFLRLLFICTCSSGCSSISGPGGQPSTSSSQQWTSDYRCKELFLKTSIPRLKEE